MAEVTDNFWDICPPEVVLMIFEYLDIKSLVNCLVVNEQFNYFALKLCQKKKWPSIVEGAFIDNGTTFRKKSNLDSMDMVKNACLWHFVHMAKAVYTHNYQPRKVTCVRIYKEDLIVVCPDEILFYNIKNNTLTSTMKYTCLDFDENDYIRAMVQFENGEKSLYLCGKRKDCSAFYWRLIAPDQHMRSFQQYKLQNEHCIISASKNSLFRLSWVSNEWNFKFLARYYGHGTISDITIYKEDVFVLLNWGGLMQLDEKGLRFRIGPNLNLPKEPSSSCIVMYNRSGAIISVPRYQKFKLRHQGADKWVMECPELTCVLQHDEMLLLGYDFGKVEVYMPQKSMSPISPGPELSFNIQKLIPRRLRDLSIIGLEVAETAASPTLFVVTQSEIHQIKLIYPENIVSLIYN